MSNKERKESWFLRNWFGIVHYGSRYLTILAICLFAFSMILYWVAGYETIIGVKSAVIIWFAAQILGILRGLK
jgi:hypothetical protein